MDGVCLLEKVHEDGEGESRSGVGGGERCRQGAQLSKGPQVGASLAWGRHREEALTL